MKNATPASAALRAVRAFRLEDGTMPDNRARGLARLASTIGGIPGCALSNFTLAPFADRDGRTKVVLTLRGRGPSLHNAIMEWTGRAQLDGGPEPIGEALEKAFANRIARQRQRAEEAIATLGLPIPQQCWETAKSAIHLHVDRLDLWAAAHKTDPGKPMRGHANQDAAAWSLCQHVAHQAAKAATVIIREGNDTGGTSIRDANGRHIRETTRTTGTFRQIELAHPVGRVTISGSNIHIGDMSLPETLALSTRQRTLREVLDGSKTLRPGFARLFGDRIVERIDTTPAGVTIRLSPDLVRIADIAHMTIADISGED